MGLKVLNKIKFNMFKNVDVMTYIPYKIKVLYFEMQGIFVLLKRNNRPKVESSMLNPTKI